MTQILGEPYVVEANLSKGSSRDQMVQSMIGTVVSHEQGTLLVGSSTPSLMQQD